MNPNGKRDRSTTFDPREPRRRHWLGSVSLTAAVILGACGDDPESPAAQPAPAVTTFEQGGFDDIPLLPQSDPLGPRSETDGVVTSSYDVRGTTPQAVMAFYAETLEPDGWVPVGQAEQLGLDTFQGDWTNTRSRSRLRVSATDTPALGGDEDRGGSVLTQYSLTLTPG